jgi:hypothetical protein
MKSGYRNTNDSDPDTSAEEATDLANLRPDWHAGDPYRDSGSAGFAKRKQKTSKRNRTLPVRVTIESTLTKGKCDELPPQYDSSS